MQLDKTTAGSRETPPLRAEVRIMGGSAADPARAAVIVGAAAVPVAAPRAAAAPAAAAALAMAPAARVTAMSAAKTAAPAAHIAVATMTAMQRRVPKASALLAMAGTLTHWKHLAGAAHRTLRTGVAIQNVVESCKRPPLVHRMPGPKHLNHPKAVTACATVAQCVATFRSARSATATSPVGVSREARVPIGTLARVVKVLGVRHDAASGVRHVVLRGARLRPARAV